MLGVVFVSMVWGMGPALVTYAFGCVLTIFLVFTPHYSFWVHGQAQQLSLFASTVLGIAIAISGSRSFGRARPGRVNYLATSDEAFALGVIKDASARPGLNELMDEAAHRALPPVNEAIDPHKFQALLNGETVFQAVLDPDSKQLAKLVLTFNNTAVRDHFERL